MASQVAAISNWLTADQGITQVVGDNSSKSPIRATASGTIDLGGGNEITFVDVEQIDYAVLGPRI